VNILLLITSIAKKGSDASGEQDKDNQKELIQYSDHLFHTMTDAIKNHRVYLENMKTLEELAEKRGQRKLFDENIALLESHLAENLSLHDKYTKKELLNHDDCWLMLITFTKQTILEKDFTKKWDCALRK
jgi:hypothetical protein